MLDVITGLIIIVIYVLLVCMAIECISRRHTRVTGGARLQSARQSPHIVVDTLNIANVLYTKKGSKKLSTEDIMNTIRRTAPILKKRHAGRVMYVLKDKDVAYNTLESREQYRRLAQKCGVHICVVEKYIDEPASERTDGADHADKGRDDFYACLLAWKWRCAVLTEDHYKDFARFRSRIKPFHVFEYVYWKTDVIRDYIRPSSPAYSAIQKPIQARYDDYFYSLTK